MAQPPRSGRRPSLASTAQSLDEHFPVFQNCFVLYHLMTVKREEAFEGGVRPLSGLARVFATPTVLPNEVATVHEILTASLVTRF